VNSNEKQVIKPYWLFSHQRKRRRMINEIYLKASDCFDSHHPAIPDLVEPYTGQLVDKDLIADWYLRVRDGWPYNPYRLSIRRDTYRASAIAQKHEGHCVDKSILLIAGYRALGIPARLHLAKVANHLAVERLTAKFGMNVVAPHGMADVFVEGRWVKASPAFNASLCVRQRVTPLDFDGTADSIFQPFNEADQPFMEYLEDYGHFEDLPLAFMIQVIGTHYPKLYDRLMAEEEIEV